MHLMPAVASFFAVLSGHYTTSFCGKTLFLLGVQLAKLTQTSGELQLKGDKSKTPGWFIRNH